MTDMRILLCTGGIGSGKSTVARAFGVLGAPVYDCDRAAKELYDRDPGLLEEVVELAGREVLGPDGRLDRVALSGRIFADPQMLAAIEELVHPAVARDFARWKEAHDAPVGVIESAILLEKPNLAGLYDRVLAVSLPEETRVRRTMLRDGLTEAQVRSRMAKQWTDEQRAAHADWTIVSNDRQALLPAIIDILDLMKDGKD